MLISCVTLVYGTIKLPVMRLIWYFYSSFPSSLYFGDHLLEIPTKKGRSEQGRMPEAGPSQEEEEEEVALKQGGNHLIPELPYMLKEFSCSLGKHIVMWLLQCWDNEAR